MKTITTPLLNGKETMQNKRFINHKYTTFIGLILILFTMLACNTSELFTAENAQAGYATAQAAAQNASDYATRAAPTLEAMATQASVLATQAAPSIQAGQEMLATAAANAQANQAEIRATLEAAGIDGRYLIDKAASLQPDANGNVHMTITETELNLVLQSSTLFADENEANEALQATTARMTAGTIRLSGTVERPVAGLLTITLQPLIIDNQIQFQIINAALNDNGLPQFIINTAQTTLDSTLNSTITSMPGNVIVKNIYIGEGYMTITAGKTTP